MLKIFQKLNFRFCVRFSSTKKFEFPKNPIKTSIDVKKLPQQKKIDEKAIKQLERLSLVDFGTKEGIKIVEDSIRFADQLHLVDTEGVEPMYTVLENESCYLREDITKPDTTRDELLSLAAVTEDEYYIAPLGNIALVPVDGEALREQEKAKEKEPNT